MNAKGINPLKYRKLIGMRVAAARRESGITQTQLAELIGISRVALSSYESGRVRFKIQTLMTLSKILNKPLAYFVHSFEKEENIYQPEEVQKTTPENLNYVTDEEVEFSMEISVRTYLRSLGYKKTDLDLKTNEIMQYIKSVPTFEKPKKKNSRRSGVQYLPY